MKTYYKINEISKLYNIGQDSLRYYEKLGILKPIRDNNNYRRYTTTDIYRLNVIRDLRSLGFSMQTIKTYIENRSVEESLALMQKEDVVINRKIQELYQMKKDIIRRQASLKASMHLRMEELQICILPERKCVSLKTDMKYDDMEYQLIKLSKEYEKNIYTIGNFNTGYFLNVENRNNIQPVSVFIADECLSEYEFSIPNGHYLTMYYKGERDKHYEHVKKMLAYCDEHHYLLGTHMMEFIIIDTHETKNKDEFITQLQIEVK